MKASQNCINLIKKFEGCRLTAYQDSVGVWTIGYGHTSGVKKGMVITQATAEAYLKTDLARFENNVMKFDSVYHWNQNQFDALVCFAYNIGSINGLCSNGKATIKQISALIPEYCHAGGKVLAGLVKRRAAEKELFDKGTVATATKTNTTAYVTGKTYTVQLNLNCRQSANVSSGILYTYKKGATVVCRGTATDSIGNIWVKTDKGYSVGYHAKDKAVYIK